MAARISYVPGPARSVVEPPWRQRRRPGRQRADVPLTAGPVGCCSLGVRDRTPRDRSLDLSRQSRRVDAHPLLARGAYGWFPGGGRTASAGREHSIFFLPVPRDSAHDCDRGRRARSGRRGRTAPGAIVRPLRIAHALGPAERDSGCPPAGASRPRPCRLLCDPEGRLPWCGQAHHRRQPTWIRGAGARPVLELCRRLLRLLPAPVARRRGGRRQQRS